MPSHKRRPPPSPAAAKRRRLTAAGVAAVVVVGAVIVVVLGTGGSPKNASLDQSTSGSSGRPSGPTGPSAPAVASNRCPLTDTLAPGGTVPRRIPLAVKIGNEPGPEAGGLGAARPQSGLNEADIVYDTPAEGGIMRYVAVYQCQDAASIGPVRSARWIDWHILAEFRKSIIAHVGGIAPELALLDAQPWILDGDAFKYPDYHQVPTRVAPDATYTSTSALYASFPSERTPPRPVFTYTPALPAGAKPVSSLGINFSQGTDAQWRWDPTTHEFLHYYSGVADIDAATNQQVSTTNVVVQIVHYHYGPYEESPGSTGDVEADVVGSGPGYVLRNGEEIPVTWHRPALRGVTTFTAANGASVGLAPGRTWVEIVLDTTAHQPGALTLTP